MIKINKGLDLPIEGAPDQVIDQSKSSAARTVALIGFDYHGMKPTMAVQEGDSVAVGDLLFTDKKTPGVRYTSPGAGKVAAINRGDKRALQSVVIELEGDAAVSYDAVAEGDLLSLEPSAVRERLIDSGLWTSFRTRPFSKVPRVDVKPEAIFVTVVDTNPLAASPSVVIAEKQQAFTSGLKVLTRFGAEKVFCCTGPEQISVGDSGVAVEQFAGPHPAGLAGTHIHFLLPASSKRTLLTINYQDVIAIGTLFLEGRIDTERVIAIGGPQVEKPRLIKTRLGANIHELTAGELKAEGETRVISGSVFSGRKASGAYAYLGRYHQQLSILLEGRDREFLSYLRAGATKHSVTRTFISTLTKGKLFPFTTTTNGSDRAMVPIGSFERIMPLDILPTQLLRALLVGDTATAQELGCLELDEEDLALCTYACSGKYEYGPILRDNLTSIEKEG